MSHCEDSAKLKVARRFKMFSPMSICQMLGCSEGRFVEGHGVQKRRNFPCAARGCGFFRSKPMGFIEVKDGWVQERLETLDFQALLDTISERFLLMKKRPHGFLTETGANMILGGLYSQCLVCYGQIWQTNMTVCTDTFEV